MASKAFIIDEDRHTVRVLNIDFSTGKVGGRRMHWSEKIAKDIIKRSPDKEEYVCAAGISEAVIL